jgi:ubiquinone/menaquinone biosynthesis C-methylase UbiE
MAEPNFYDEISEGYDELHMGEQLQKMVEIIASLGPDVPKKGETLLDVGCGSGISTSVWTCACTGIDPSAKLIEIAKKKCPKAKFQVGNAEELPFPDNSFDVILCVTAIHNFKDLRKAIGEFKRVGKRLFVITVLRKSGNLDEIEKLIIINFKIKRIVAEEKDLIFICGPRN